MTEEEILSKRLIQLEKKVDALVKEINNTNRLYLVSNRIELYNYVARAIKNESEIDMIKEFFINKDQWNIKDYLNFRKDNEILKTYIDESKTIYELIDYYEKLRANPDLKKTISDYVNSSNLIIMKNRFQIKRKDAIKRGIEEKSEFIIEIDKGIVEIDLLLGSLFKNKNEVVFTQEYYVKKEDAEKIFERLILNKDDIIDRIKQVPLLNKIQMEPNNSSLYYETISNYWYGNFNGSIILLSVFLESFLKEIYFFKKKENTTETLNPLIEICHNNGYITLDEKIKLLGFTDIIRNNYIHANISEIIEKVIIPAYKIDLSNPKSSPVATYVTSDDLPTIRAIAKMDIDKIRSRNLIIQIINIVSEISKRIYTNEDTKNN